MIKPKRNIANLIPERIFPKDTLRLKLDKNENIYGIENYIISAIKNIDFEDVSKIPNNEKFTDKLSKYLNTDKDNIIALNDTFEGISAIINLYLDNESEMIIFQDVVSQIENLVLLNNSKIIKANYQYNLEDIEKIISPKTKIIYLSSPNLETGEIIRASFIEFLTKKYPDILFIIDCSYINYSENATLKDFVDLADNCENVIILKSFSYDFALCGLKLGFVYSQKENIDNLKKIIPADNVNLIALKCGCSSLNNIASFEEIKNKNLEALKMLKEGLIERGFKPYNSEGNFILCNFFDYTDFYYQKLKNNGVIVKKYKKTSPYSTALRITVPKTGGVKYILELLNKKDLIIFDIDGVIFDVRNSYHQVILQTFKHFAGFEIDREEIIKTKSQGGFNCDWNTVQYLLNKYGFDVDINDISKVFQNLFYNPMIKGQDFLIDKEKLILSKEIIEALNEKYDLVIFTGRYRFEAQYSLKKFGIDKFFNYLVTADDLEKEELKPEPCGVFKILKHCPHKSVKYIGDSVDDVIAGNKAEVETIGVIAPGSNEANMKNNFKHLCANYILDDINSIIDFLENNEQN